MVGPYIGALVGGSVYETFIGLRVPCCNNDDDTGDVEVSLTPIDSGEVAGIKDGGDRKKEPIKIISKARINGEELTSL